MIDENERQALEQDIANALEAEKLLGNALLQSIIFSRKNAACQLFMETNMNEDKARLQAWHSVQGFIAFEGSLQQLVKSGKIAQETLSNSGEISPVNNNPMG